MTIPGPLSVNEAIDDLSALAGSDVCIVGILSFDFEHVAIEHHPQDGRRGGYASSIWLEVGSGSLGFDRKVCMRLDGKRVSVQGTLLAPDPRLGGCGHMSLWPAAVLARTVEPASFDPDAD